jgi:transcriptional regulator with XRE-family HTH domain
MGLGERIRDRRTELNWTQDVLAQKSGISKGFLSDVENGKRSIGAETLLDVARVLGLSLDYLMTGQDAEDHAKEIEIPPALARFASEAGISFRQTMMLLAMQRQIIAHRSATKNRQLDEVDWRRFYESVKVFL